ncbi:MAG: hypothetical protein POELPBGB_03845 [Bacteroidia bacterium]|nr:hypothetical protein [Bacteroidia bacterium]
MVLFLLPFVAYSQQITFEIIYGGEGYDEARSIWQTTDGGYIVAGTSGSYPSGNSDVFLLKIDSVGAIQWFKFPGGSDLQAGYSVQQTSDGGFIVAGLTDAGDFGGYDVYLMKADENGDFLWSKTYGGADWDFGYSVEETSDNGFIIGGTTFSFGKGEQMYMIKTDAAGDTAWTKTYGGAGQENAKRATQTTDGGYVLIGYSDSYGAGEKDIFILKTDASGDSVWSKTYGTPNNDEGTFVDVTSDNKIIMCGFSENYQDGKIYAFYAKLDNAGNESFSNYLGTPVGDELPATIRETTDGGFAYAGSVLGIGAGNKDYRLVKIDGGGNYQWGKTYGGANDDISNAMLVTSDSGFVLAGSTMSYGNGSKDIYIFKSDNQGVSTGNVLIDVKENSLSATNQISVYPNPGDQLITVFADINTAELDGDILILLNDISGKEILKTQVKKNQFNKVVELDINSIPAGLYFLNFTSSTFSFQRKVLIQH